MIAVGVLVFVFLFGLCLLVIGVAIKAFEGEPLPGEDPGFADQIAIDLIGIGAGLCGISGFALVLLL